MRSFYDEVNQSRFGVNRDFTTQRKFSPRYAAEVEVPTAEARFIAEAEATHRLSGEVDRLNALDPNIGIADRAFTRSLEGLGASEIENELNRQALGDLNLGGKLSPQQVRDSQQSARAAYASRGLENSSPAAAAEILSRDQYQQALQSDRRNFAMNVDNQSNAREQNDRSFSIQGMQAARAFTDPRQQIFGAGGSQVSGQSGAARIGDFLPYVGEIEGQNQQEAFQARQADLNRANAVNLAQIGYAHQASQLQQQQQFDSGQAHLDRQRARQEFTTNRADSNRNAARNADAAKKASTNSALSSAGTAIAGAGITAIAGGAAVAGTAGAASAVGIGLVLF